ncbi:hypothetical protein C8T65DRAFT_749658, partial [Cerioporus squamosus]
MDDNFAFYDDHQDPFLEDDEVQEEDIDQLEEPLGAAAYNDEYVEMPTRTVLLSDLERNFNSHNQERALSLLQRKNLLKVDSRYLYAANDPKIYWKLSE